jgi:hypothetical protein
MNTFALSRTFVVLACLVILSSLPSAAARAQRREHLTPEEIELIREAQELDRRTAVFVKAAERRLLALTDPAAAARQSAKDAEKWGEVKGTRTQLFNDVAKILDEAVVNIDDTAARDQKSSLLHKSLGKLAEAAARFVPRLTAMRDAAQSVEEREALESAVEKSQEILEAAKRHETDAPEKPSKKGSK